MKILVLTTCLFVGWLVGSTPKHTCSNVADFKRYDMGHSGPGFRAIIKTCQLVRISWPFYEYGAMVSKSQHQNRLDLDFCMRNPLNFIRKT